MNTAIITLSGAGFILANHIAHALPNCTVYLHQAIQTDLPVKRFERVIALSEQIFTQYTNLIYIMPTGVVVRAIAAQVRHKLQDPAVVVVDVGGRWAISLLSGHEGGANQLAMQVANAIQVEPIVTTTTEAVRRLIIGIGCRKNMSAVKILEAIHQGLALIQQTSEDVRMLATAEPKKSEVGLIEASQRLELPLRVLSSQLIRQTFRSFEVSEFVQEKVNLPAVAEPSALLAGHHTRLLLPKQCFDGITIAIAEEMQDFLKPSHLENNSLG